MQETQEHQKYKLGPGPGAYFDEEKVNRFMKKPYFAAFPKGARGLCEEKGVNSLKTVSPPCLKVQASLASTLERTSKLG